MKRRLFFIFEKLQIKRSERIAITGLFLMLLLLSVFRTFYESEPNYDKHEYERLEKIFREKSKAIQREKDLILARYKPGNELPAVMSVRSDPHIKPEKKDTVDQKNKPGTPGTLVNVNKATSEQLQELPGIGPAYAKRIITWRQKNGDFVSKDQLLEIKGIGEKRLAKIKPLITI